MILGICADPSVLKVMRIIKIVINFIKIIVPIILIVAGALTFLKAVTDGDNKKALQAFIRKCIAAVAIFLVPTFVGIILKLVDQERIYYDCLANANKEGIAAAQAEQAEYYIINAKSTLNESTYRAALSVVNNMDDGPTKNKYLKEMEQVKADTEAAIKEREEKYKQANSPSSSSTPSTGISPTGQYTPVEAMDMEESKVQAMSKQECMDYVASMARDIYFKNGGVLPSITVAQAVLESGYCKHFVATSHNLYGLRGYPGSKPKVYTASGGNYLRQFDNFYEATYYHYAYFQNYSNVYANFLKECANHNAIAAASYLGAYCGGSKTYGPTIQQLIRQYNLTKYDY